MNLTNFKNYLKINLLSFNSQKTYYNRIKCFFDYYPEFNQENINAYIAKKLDEGRKEQWFNQTMTAFRHYEKSLGIYGTFKYPRKKKISHNERNYLTEEEIKKELFPYFSRIFKNPEFNQFIVEFLFYTGVRPNEMIKLKKDDIFFDKQYFVVRNPKDKDDKKVPFPKFLNNKIKKYLNEEGNVFNLTFAQITYIFSQLNKQLNYKIHLHSYICRHSYAKYVLNKGVTIEKLQILMGHSSLKTTMIYAKPKVEDALNSYFDKIG